MTKDDRLAFITTGAASDGSVMMVTSARQIKLPPRIARDIAVDLVRWADRLDPPSPKDKP